MIHPMFLTVIAGLFVFLFILGFLMTPEDPIAVLRDRYFALVRLPRGEAVRELDHRIEGLTVRFPGKPYTWYLRWLVRDLERAKDAR